MARLISKYKEDTPLATLSAQKKAVSLASKSSVVLRAKAQASSGPSSGFSAMGQNKDGYKCKGSRSRDWVEKVSFDPQVLSFSVSAASGSWQNFQK